MFETKVIPAFGGGINLAGHSANLRDDEWTWANGVEAVNGCAQTGRIAILRRTGAGYKPASTAIVGMCPDLMAIGAANTVLVATRNDVGEAVRLFQVDPAGTATEKTASGTAATGETHADVFTKAIMLPVQLNGLQILTFGIGPNHSMATYDGTNHARIAPGSFTLTSRFLIATQGYVIAASTAETQVGRRTLRISDASAPTVWEPAASNSADTFAVEFATDIRGLLPTGDGALVFGGDRIVQLTATGGIPPFTVRLVAEHGMPARMGMCVNTPFGPVFAGARTLHGVQGEVPGAEKGAPMALNPFLSGTTVPKLLWDEISGAIVVPTTAERWYFNPTTQAWWRTAWEATPVDHTMGMSGTNDLDNGLYYFVTSAGDVYQGNATPSFASAFVDTKDFAFMLPSDNDYIDRLLIDWEPLSNASTDAITVSAFTRNEMRSSGLASSDFSQDYSASFTSLGTVTTPTREIACRLRGRYTRFRFASSSGAFRIRGFSIRRQRGSERAK